MTRSALVLLRLYSVANDTRFVPSLALDGAVAAPQPSRSASRDAGDVETLASERSDGREAGSAGERLAGDYIALQLARLGAGRSRAARHVPAVRVHRRQPDGGSRSVVTARASDAAQVLTGATTCRRCRSRTTPQSSGPVVFAGYGLVVPESQSFGYDSYAGLDVKDKIVVVLRYFPEDADPQTKATLARYSDLRYKALAARQRGAKGAPRRHRPALAQRRRRRCR